MGTTLTIMGAIVCVLASVTLLAFALRSRRSAEVDDDAAAGHFKALGALLRPDEGKGLEDLKNRATRAGLYTQDQLDLFLSARLIAAVVGLGLIVLVVTSSDDMLSAITSMLLIAVVSVVGPGWWLDRRAAQRQAALSRSLPAALELLVVCLGAGLGLMAALERVAAASERGDLLADELGMVVDDVQMGIPVEQAFRRLAARTGSEEIGAFAGVIIKASAMGAQIGELLAAHAERMRHKALMALEEKAGKANAKLSLPLTMCLLPSGMLVLLAPPLISLLEAL